MSIAYVRWMHILKAVPMVQGSLQNVYIEGIGKWWTKVNGRREWKEGWCVVVTGSFCQITSNKFHLPMK
jgi:hypothetical protein